MNKNYFKSALSTLLILWVCVSVSAQKDSIVINCKANFSFEQNLAVNSSPFAYNFYNLSEGESLSYFWDFGDGTSSTVENPMHAYQFYYKDGNLHSAVANPTVCLTVTNFNNCKTINCKQIITEKDSIVPTPGCEAKIYVSEVTQSDSISVIPELKNYKFEAASNPDGISWKWFYNDSLFSTQRTTSLILPLVWSDKYQNYGNEICVIVTTADSCTIKVCQFVPWNSQNEDCNSVFSSYRIDSLTNSNSALIQFVEKSTGTVVKWNWDFGDSTFSDVQNPVHEYNIPDIRCLQARCLVSYLVCLKTTTDNGCQSSYCETVYPTNYPQPNCQAKFSYSIGESYPPTYLFKNESTISDSSITYWDFGDGTFSYENNPSHVFTNKTLKNIDMYSSPVYQWAYSVCLTVSDGKGCKNTSCQDVFAKPDTFYSICKSQIKLSTSSVLGSNNCNATASASLIDASGNIVKGSNYQWSTGAATESVAELCANAMYSVSITDPEGCTVVGSFAISDYSNPWSPVTYWGYEKMDSSYIFKSLVNNPNYISSWHFSDGTTQDGAIIYRKFENSNDAWVDLVVNDSAGNVIYSNRILLPYNTTRVNSVRLQNLKIYPVPAESQIHIELNAPVNDNTQLEITDIMGKVLVSTKLTSRQTSLNIEGLSKGIYVCRVKSGSNMLQIGKFIK